MDSKRRYRTSSVDPDEDTNVSHIDTRGRAFGALLSHFNTPLDDGFERNNTQIQDTTSIDPYQTAQSCSSPLPRSSTSNLAEDSPSTSPYLDTIGIEDDTANEIRIVLIGKTGTGKSATANTLIGQNVLQSKASASSITTQCQKVEGFRDGKRLIVVDTPGLFDTQFPQEIVTQEITKCIGILSPGPHAVVLVVRIGRITKEEQDTVDHCIKHFGEQVLKYMIVLFTKVDDLIGEHDEDLTLDGYVQTVPDALRNILRRCDDRFLGFNNKANGNEMELQLKRFFASVENMVAQNGGSCYTNETFKQVERAIKKRMLEQLEKQEKLKQFEIQQLKSKIEREYEEPLKKVDEQQKEIYRLAKEIHLERVKNEEERMHKDRELKNAEHEKQAVHMRMSEDQIELEKQKRLELEKMKSLMEQVKNEQQTEIDRLKEEISREKQERKREKTLKPIKQVSGDLNQRIRETEEKLNKQHKLEIKREQSQIEREYGEELKQIKHERRLIKRVLDDQQRENDRLDIEMNSESNTHATYENRKSVPIQITKETRTNKMNVNQDDHTNVSGETTKLLAQLLAQSKLVEEAISENRKLSKQNAASGEQVRDERKKIKNAMLKQKEQMQLLAEQQQKITLKEGELKIKKQRLILEEMKVEKKYAEQPNTDDLRRRERDNFEKKSKKSCLIM